LLVRLQAALGDRYTVQCELGRGGMAVVYGAQDCKHHRLVAIKVLRPDIAATLGPERFLREIEIAAPLNHPHILPLLDSGEADGLLYFVMPYVEGESLRDRLVREKQLSLEEALQITHQVADGLSYAHSHGVVHRDIKPENILLESGHAVVADFGIARAITAARGGRLTGVGIAVGTPAYMSPEQARGDEELDGRSDLYSLGCVLYEMLAGQPPFAGASPHAVLSQHKLDPVPPMTTVRKLPRHVERAISRALAKTPAERFATVRLFAQALLSNPEAGRDDVSSRAGVWRGALAASLIVATGVGGWVLNAHRRRTVAPPSPDRVAVFPFAVEAGPQYEHLGEAVMDLLGSAVDGMGNLRRVDPVAVIGLLRRDSLRLVDPTIGESLAREVGAGRYVVGAVTPVGGEMRVSASLYDVGHGSDPVGRSSRQGAEEALATLAESVATDLLASVPLGRGARLEKVATVHAANYPALKAYLTAERYLRIAQEDSAKQLLRRAVTLDSTFALAWYRLTWAEDFTYDYRMGRSADQAYRFRDRLAPVDQMLVAITSALVHGQEAQAESLALVTVGTYPDAAEAWWLLGTLRFWGHWRVGRSPLEGLGAYTRALQLDPGNRFALYNAPWLHMYGRDNARADSDAVQARAHGVADPRLWHRFETQSLLHALRDGDRHAQDSLLVELAAEPDQRLSGFGVGLTRFTDELDAGQRALHLLLDPVRRGTETRGLAHALIALLDLSGGQWDQAQRAFAEATAGEPGLAHTYRAFFAAAPFLERSRGEVLGLRDSLRHWQTDSPRWQMRPDDTDTWVWGQPPELRDRFGIYLRGLLSARAGDAADAEAQARRLESARDPADSAGLLSDLALEIRALAAFERGQTEQALAILERMKLRTTWHYQQYASPFYMRPLARLLRAEALNRLGRYQEALGWYWFAVLPGPECVFQAPAYLRSAEIYEKLGDRDRALEYYRRFVTRWRNADASYQPLVREVDGRIARLAATHND